MDTVLYQIEIDVNVLWENDKTFVIDKAEQNVILAINNEVAFSEQITPA